LFFKDATRKKLYDSKSGIKVTTEAIQVHGGCCYFLEHDVKGILDI